MEGLVDKYLEGLSKDKKITKAEAAKMLNACITETSIKFNIPYNDVYLQVYNEKHLTSCLKDTCSELDLEECRKSCRCIEYDGKCTSKEFPDAEEINSDPDKYIINKKISTEDLDKMVRFASYLYYNYDAGGLTDNSFDALQYHLKKRLKLKGRAYEKIGAPPVDKIREKLPYPLPSLKKAYPGTQLLYNFIENHESIAWSLKLDGVSGMVIYDQEGILGIYTRGDGSIGGNITYVKDYIVLPNITTSKDILAVRGEFILSKKKWEEKYKGEYSNARSFVSGKINSGFISPALVDIDFVAYEIISLEGERMNPPPSKVFKILENEGFNTVENGVLVDALVFDLMSLYKEKRETSPYFIDGLVIDADVKRMAVMPGSAPANPDLALAFKMHLQEQIRKTKVVNVDWGISRYGRYIPVAVFESVYIEGVRLHRATAYNAAHIRDWSMGKGTEITIIRSGDVIPNIRDVEVNLDIEPIMPSLEPEWHWERSHILLNDIEGNKNVQIKRMVHFFSTLGVPRLKDKTAEKLWDAGMKFPEQVAAAKPQDYQKIKGIGKKTAEFLYEKIHEKLKTTPIDRYLVASTTLEVGLGRKLIKTLFRHFPKIFEYTEEEIRASFKKTKIPGFGPKRIENVAVNMPKFREYLFSFAESEIKEALKYNEERLEKLKSNSSIAGKIFVLTGFQGKNMYDFEDYIYENKGDFSGKVTSNTEAVISANILEISKKMQDAHDLGVKVLSLQEFEKRYKK